MIPRISLNRSVIRMRAYAVRLLRLRRIEFSVHTGHKVTASASAKLSAGDAGSHLDAIASESGVDIIVAGAYGHSRLRVGIRWSYPPPFAAKFNVSVSDALNV